MPPTTASLRSSRLIKLLCVLCASVVHLPAPAATITGRVSNLATKEYLQDALVEIPSLQRVVRTDAHGDFSFDNIPAGTHRLVVSYPGLDEAASQVAVSAASANVSSDFELKSTVYQLDEFVVSAEREGNAAAIVRQMASEEVKTVAAFGGLGGNPTESAGDLLVRLPGIAGVLNEDGEISEIFIRGVSGERNVASMDGIMSTGTSADTRGSGFFGTGAIFSEVEVVKGFRPDMAMGSLSGAINIKTRNVLSMREKQRIYYEAQGRWTPGFYDHIPMVAEHPLHPYVNFQWSRRFDAFGIRNSFAAYITLANQTRVNGVETFRQIWQQVKNDPDGNPLALPDTPYRREFLWNDVATYRTTSSALLKLEFQPSKNDFFYITTYLDDQKQKWSRKYEQDFDVTSYDAPGTDPYQTPEPNPAKFEVATMTKDYIKVLDGRFDLQIWNNSNHVTTTNFQAGGNHTKLGGRLKLDYKAAYGSTEIDYANANGGVYEIPYITGISYAVTKRSGAEIPFYIQQLSGPNVFDPETYNHRNATFYRSGSDRKSDSWNFIGNAQLATGWAGDLTFKTGLHLRGYQFRQSAKNYEYWTHNAGGLDAFGNPTAGMSAYLSSDTISTADRMDAEMPLFDTGLLMKSLQSFINNADKSDPNWAHYTTNEWFQTSGNEFNTEYYKIYYDRGVKENVYATFLQASAKFKKALFNRDLSLLGGLRLEHTKVTGDGFFRWHNIDADTEPNGYLRARQSYDRDGDGIPDRVYNNADYNQYFPSIHLNYTLSPTTRIRASWSTSTARPSFYDYLPNFTWNSTERTVYMNNPDIKPQFGRNINLEFLWNPRKAAALMTIGLFRQDISDFIYTASQGQIDENTPGPGTPSGVTDPNDPRFQRFEQQFWGYDLRSRLNGGKAEITGLELSWVQNRLNFLPGLLRGFGFFANLTVLHTSGDYGRTGQPSTKEVVGFVPRTINTGISYAYKRFECSVRMNYTSDRLYSYSDYRSDLVYEKAHTFVDVSAIYKAYPWMHLYCNVRNVLNEMVRQQYQAGRKDLVRYYNLAAPTIEFGARGSF